VGIEVWAQNLFKKDYTQVAFNSPFQEGATSTAPFTDPQFPGGRQIFSAYPRRAAHLRPDAARPLLGAAAGAGGYVAPPAPVVPAPAVQTCADGSVIAVDAACPVVAPPAPVPAPERG
jgi:hypothetical protein